MLITTKATDLQGNPKDDDLARRVPTRAGYGVWIAPERQLAETPEQIEKLIGERLYLSDPRSRFNDVLTSVLKEVSVQDDGTVQLVTNNTIYFMQKEEVQ